MTGVRFPRRLVLDGGMATELERRGYSVSGPLWSGHVLHDRPEAVAAVHRDYVEAGADVISTATYQVTPQGLAAIGVDSETAAGLLRLGVHLAHDARRAAQNAGRATPLYVAASIGPYGAYRHDGSEYRGNYGLSVDELVAFHRPRFSILADDSLASQVDLLALETIPCVEEADALLALLHDYPGRQAWMAFQCRDGRHLADGTSVAEAIRHIGDHPAIVAVGVNCVPPEFVLPLIDQIAPLTHVPIVVYPNSGERWNMTARQWEGEGDPAAFGRQAAAWLAAGATWIGGCCRTGPAHIKVVRDALASSAGNVRQSID